MDTITDCLISIYPSLQYQPLHQHHMLEEYINFLAAKLPPEIMRMKGYVILQLHKSCLALILLLHMTLTILTHVNLIIMTDTNETRQLRSPNNPHDPPGLHQHSPTPFSPPISSSLRYRRPLYPGYDRRSLSHDYVRT